MSVTGSIFDIQRFSVHDGPGIRTTVFLKGCSLHCFWCHNPEGLDPKQQIQFSPARCMGCGACLQVCAQGAHEVQDGGHQYRRGVCVTCGRCTQECFSGALQLIGRMVTVEEVMTEVLQDRAFYETSGGGVTLSGGEPALQVAFSRALLERCKAQGLHTAIETAGNVPWDALAALLPVTDLVMMDIKHMDPGKHRMATGAGNRRILANARLLAQTEKPLILRVPVVPAVNDTEEEISAIAAFARRLLDLRAGANAGEIQLELLPLHRLATDKYRHLGLEYRAAHLQPPSRETVAHLAATARAHGIAVLSR